MTPNIDKQWFRSAVGLPIVCFVVRQMEVPRRLSFSSNAAAQPPASSASQTTTTRPGSSK